MASDPITKRVRARDLLPYRHAIWCTVGGHGPFANPIVSKRLRDDGRISIMLDSHNFDQFDADEFVDVVEIEPHPSQVDSLEAEERCFQGAADWKRWWAC